jgi:hypothetical protein
MSEPRRIIIGVIPSGQDVTYVGEGAVDPVAFLIDEANAKLDAERAAEARALAAKAPETDLLAFLRPRPDSGIGGGSLMPSSAIADREETQRCHEEGNKDENPNKAQPNHVHFAQLGPPAALVRFETLVVLCICVLIPALAPSISSGRRTHGVPERRVGSGER